MRAILYHLVRISNSSVSRMTDSSNTFSALLYGAFRLLRDFASETVAAHQVSAQLGPVHNIRQLLRSSDPQDHYVFVSCLQCLNPNLWAGTDPERPAVLEGWEVERVMTLLDSTDSLIRKRVRSYFLRKCLFRSWLTDCKTIDILYRVDPGIVSAYFAQAIQGIPSILTLKEKNEYIIRLLEVIERQSENDGESYAQQLKELFAAVYQEAVPERQPVLEVAVEKVLIHIKEGA